MLVRRDNTCDHVCEEDGDRVQSVSRPAQANRAVIVSAVVKS